MYLPRRRSLIPPGQVVWSGTDRRRARVEEPAEQTLLEFATDSIGAEPWIYMDFTKDRSLFKGEDVGGIEDTPGWSNSGTFVRDENGLTIGTRNIKVTLTELVYPAWLWVRFKREVDTGAGEVYLQLRASNTERANLFVTGADSLAMSVVAGGSTVASPGAGAGTATVGAIHRLAGRVQQDNFNVAGTGTLGTLDTAGATPTAPIEMNIGSNNGAAFCGNPILELAVGVGAISDAILADIT